MANPNPTCTHLDTIEVTELPAAVNGCEDCLREGGVWMHLRICLSCGHVGCCDDSPRRHASGHAASSGHQLIRLLGLHAGGGRLDAPAHLPELWSRGLL